MKGAETIKVNQYAEQGSILNKIHAKNIYILVGYTDMRLSIDGLAAKVQQVFRLDPCDRSLFLFCGKRNDRIKAIFWEGDGFLLLYKRLESAPFQWPRREAEARLISQRQLRWLLEGLSIEQPKAFITVGSRRMV